MVTNFDNMVPDGAKPIKVLDFKVDGIYFYSATLYCLELSPCDSEVILPHCAPGQFVQVQVPQDGGVFLRRPISIYDLRDQRTLVLLVQSVGKGTIALSKAQVGDVVNVILPLGNSFKSPLELCTNTENRSIRPLLIGGGVGLAPLLMLGKSLKKEGIIPTFLFGARSKSYFPDLSEFEQVGELFITTEDASWGEKGFVTNHSILTSEPPFDCVYTCGPTPMMKAVAQLAKDRNIPCQVSLENMMACGLGVCLCCTEPTVKGYKCVCTDGPVFDSTELMW